MVRNPAGEQRFARIKVPTSLPRLMPLEDGAPLRLAGRRHRRQPGGAVPRPRDRGRLLFQVLRDADMEIQEDEAPDLLETIEQGLRQRQFGPVVRLVVDEAMPDAMVQLLMENLEVAPDDVYPLQPPLAMRSLWASGRLNRPDLKDTPFVPAVPPQLRDLKTAEDVFAAIRTAGHPAAPPVRFLQAGAGLHQCRGGRSRRAGHQADPLPGGAERAGGAGAAGGAAQRQAGGRAGGAEGALRRGEQHRLGPRAGSRGGARGLRPGGAEDAQQDHVGGAPARRAACAATCTWRPATTTRSPPASTPTWAC